jgi:hypothetical protein
MPSYADNCTGVPTRLCERSATSSLVHIMDDGTVKEWWCGGKPARQPWTLQRAEQYVRELEERFEKLSPSEKDTYRRTLESNKRALESMRNGGAGFTDPAGPEHHFPSVDAWKAELARRGWSTVVRSSKTSMPVFRFGGVLNEHELPLGNILQNTSKASKVIVTKKGLLEIRRGDITWKKGETAARNCWETVAAWREWLERVGFEVAVETVDGYSIREKFDPKMHHIDVSSVQPMPIIYDDDVIRYYTQQRVAGRCITIATAFNEVLKMMTGSADIRLMAAPAKPKPRQDATIEDVKAYYAQQCRAGRPITFAQAMHEIWQPPAAPVPAPAPAPTKDLATLQEIANAMNAGNQVAAQWALSALVRKELEAFKAQLRSQLFDA